MTSATTGTAGARDSTPAATRLALLATLAITAAAVAEYVRRRPDAAIEPGFAGAFLWLFSALFLVRVAGQLVVRVRHPSWLPPTEEWNLTPYRLLLPVQLTILGVMAWVDSSFSGAAGAPVDARPGLGEGVVIFAYVYAGSMLARYAVRMTRRPGERWFGGTIPIVFHLVLAAYLYVFGSFHASY